MKSSIYRIVAPSGNCYIGSSVNVARRFVQHKSELRRRKHPNDRLQAAYDKYGEALLFEAIFTVLHAQYLDAYEQHFIDSICPAYNKSQVAKCSTRDPLVALRVSVAVRASVRHATARTVNQKLAAAAVSRQIVRLTDNNLFDSGYAAARDCKAKTPDNIFTAVKSGRKFCGHFWAWADTNVSLADLCSASDEREVDRKRNATASMIKTKRRAGRRVWDGTVFYSIAEAARMAGCCHAAINRALKYGTYAVGSRWEYA